jgi:hypothetical protein
MLVETSHSPHPLYVIRTAPPWLLLRTIVRFWQHRGGAARLIKNTLKLCCRLCNIDATLGCIARHYSAPHLCQSSLSMHVSEHRSFLFSSHSLGTELGRHHKVAWAALGCHLCWACTNACDEGCLLLRSSATALIWQKHYITLSGLFSHFGFSIIVCRFCTQACQATR